jgi:uncharacterized membrane protein
MKVASKSISLSEMLTLSSASFFAAIVAFSEPAHAWFQVCNRSTESASVAFAYLEIGARRCDIFGSCPPRPQNGWSSQGWWNLAPGQCAQTYPHELRKRNSVYYVYAKGKRGGEWKGEHSFCTISRTFTLGNANNVCGNAGEWKRFKEVRTGNARNFTYNLQN